MKSSRSTTKKRKENSGSRKLLKELPNTNNKNSIKGTVTRDNKNSKKKKKKVAGVRSQK